jgi:hypothetical protein
MDLETIAGGELMLDEELLKVAARIRPLPAHIVPSPRFVAQTRLRLVNLPVERSSTKAA